MFVYYFSSCLIVSALGCNHQAPGAMPRFEVHHEPEADIWLGELEFVNLFCGTGRVKPSIFTTIQDTVRDTVGSVRDTVGSVRDTVGSVLGGLFRRSADNGDPDEINVHDLTQEELNRYKLDHSLLYFRGQSYEFGAGMFMRSFGNGTVNRNPEECGNGITWTYLGRSNCTFDQAMQMAYSYRQTFGEYALLTNNCHVFVQKLYEKLNNGHCEPFSDNGRRPMTRPRPRPTGRARHTISYYCCLKPYSVNGCDQNILLVAPRSTGSTENLKINIC